MPRWLRPQTKDLSLLQAVIFDLDGTLVDSEQHGHRIAFNEAFAAFDLDDRWTPEIYRGLLATTGGERRIYGWLSGPESNFAGRPEAERREMASALHRWKSARVQEMASAGAIPARPGVGQWLDDLSALGIRLAVATTGSRQWAGPLLDQVFGKGRFEMVVAGDDVTARKPDPEAYLIALDRLGLDRRSVVAVEDSGPGFEAARRAGVACVVVANEETDLARVAEASLILAGFEPSDQVVEDRFGASKAPGGVAGMLAELLARETMEP